MVSLSIQKRSASPEITDAVISSSRLDQSETGDYIGIAWILQRHSALLLVMIATVPPLVRLRRRLL
jgi:hypothetical protein